MRNLRHIGLQSLIAIIVAILILPVRIGAIPTRVELLNMSYAFKGQPFVALHGQGLSLLNMNYSFMGQPFVTTSIFDISNAPNSKAFGIVSPTMSYYAKGSAPANPVIAADCTFTITNSGDAVNIAMKVTDFTGGNTWNIVSTAPSGDEVRITAYYVGQNPASGLVLTNADQIFYNNLTSSSTLQWDFKMETGGTAGNFSDGVPKTATLTITAS